MHKIFAMIMLWLSGAWALAHAFPFHHRLLGEWSVWHSNVPSSMGSNRVIVGLYPDSMIEVSQKFCIGPCILEKTKFGTYELEKTYEYEKERDLDPVYRTSVHLHFHRRRHHLLSVFGIGLDSVPLTISESWTYEQDMSLYIVEQGDLFLTFPSKEDAQVYCYHLVRNVRTKEPSVNVPLSTLVATHIFGTLISEVIKHLKHSFP